jgi:hypothetical protein
MMFWQWVQGERVRYKFVGDSLFEDNRRQRGPQRPPGQPPHVAEAYLGGGPCKPNGSDLLVRIDGCGESVASGMAP